jgi:hypothetical protein
MFSDPAFAPLVVAATIAVVGSLVFLIIDSWDDFGGEE